jgi:xanthine/CO dehydrogenase XdhC/CoxF family maturation factor
MNGSFSTTSAQSKQATKLIKKVIDKRKKTILVNMFSLKDKKNEQPGTCLLVEENDNIAGSIPYPELQKSIMEDVGEVMHQQWSSFKNYTTGNFSVNAFIEYLQPPISLVVIGAGNDAIPMMQIADILGWDVRVVDGRGTHARPERFESACQVLVSKPEKVLEQIAIDKQTVFVLMTHNYNYDMAMLKALLHQNATYVGLLGPKKKLDRMIDEIRDEGIKIDEEALKKIYGPVGLEIGAETAEEIALSIIAEIKAVLAGKPGGSLREKQDVIHSRNDTIIEIKNLH